jgi:5-formyltetrahydrofolate cyclo-ligase
MLRLGKRVVVPKVSGRRLLLCELKDPDRDLAPGSFGVWEPLPHAMRPVSPKALELVIIPGLAFDRRGHRLGHGLGYFDRFLRRVPRSAARIGVCFDFQLLDHLPNRPHDQAVDRVLAA